MWNLRWFRKSTDHEKRIIRFIRSSFGFTPGDITLYSQALRHSSAAKRIGRGIKNSNERLEFLGDAILDAVVADYLYKTFPKITEGQLTKMKAKVVSRKYFNFLGEKISLDKNLQFQLGSQELQKSIVGNAFEAVVGAIYLDKGFEFTYKVTLELLKTHGLDKKVHSTTDFKSKLHEWCQKHKKSLTFEMLSEEKKNGGSSYVMEARIDGNPAGVGAGRSKKTAEQRAAQESIKLIKLK